MRNKSTFPFFPNSSVSFPFIFFFHLTSFTLWKKNNLNLASLIPPLALWYICQTHTTSFSWACQGRMVILLGVPREDAHSHGRAGGWACCEAQSRLGLTSAKPSIPRAWRTAKPNRVWIWIALDPTCPWLGTLPSPPMVGLDTLPNPHLRHAHSFKHVRERMIIRVF
jgi:hypothetical protein